MAYFRCVGSVQNTVTLSLTVHGAKGDNIGIYDENFDIVGSAIFDAEATSKLISIEIQPNKVYAFISTIAKATDGSTLNYSKNILLNRNTTDVYVMPDDALFWYGNECGSVTDGWNSNEYKYSDINNGGTISIINSAIKVQSSGSGTVSVFGTENQIDLTNYSKIKFSAASLDSEGFFVGLASNKAFSSTDDQVTVIGAEKIYEIDISNINTSKYILIYVGLRTSADMHVSSIWLE